jgi:hypothetical protein
MPPDATSAISSNRSSLSRIISARSKGSADACVLYSLGILGWLGARRLVSSASLALGAFVLISGAVVVAYQACAIYDPTLLLPGDAGPGAALDAACAHAYYPDRPAQDDPSTLTVEVVLAVQSIDLGVSPDAGTGLAPYGFDLDHVCTCPGPPSCVQEQGAPLTCDDDMGRDHAGLELFRELGSLAPAGSQQTNQGLQAGQYGLIFDIQNYNGKPNDKQVSVSVYASNGISGVEDGGASQPSHDGTDRWTLDPTYIIGGSKLDGSTCDQNVCKAIYFDDTAYIKDNVLVARIDFPVSFGTKSFLGGAVMNLKGSVIVGTLEQVAVAGGGSSYRITEGTIAGRWPTRLLLQTLAAIPDNVSNTSPYLCGPDSFGYLYLRYRACQVADITSNPMLDNTNAPCDAVSMGFRFAAEPAHLGEVYGIPPPPAGCTTEGGLPFTDSCFAQ